MVEAKERTVRSFLSLVRRGVVYVLIMLFDTLVILATKRGAVDKTRVLIVRADQIGDFVLWLPAAWDLRAMFPRPHVRLILAANAVWADLAVGQDIFDEVWPIDMRDVFLNPLYRFRVLRRVRIAGFGAALQPTYSRELLRGDSLIRASGAPERIGSSGDEANIGAWAKRITDRWYTRLIPATRRPLMELERNAEFVRGLGGLSVARMPTLRVNEDDVPQEMRVAPYFVLFPGAKWAGKRWAAERFAEIATRVIERYGWVGVVCGGHDDAAVARKVCDMAGAALRDMTGKTTLQQLAAIMAHARLVLTNDTSAAHIGSAAGAPTVCVLGGGHYGRFLPYDLPDVRSTPTVVSYHMNCFGCNWRCIYRRGQSAPFPCVENVSVTEVWRSISDALGSRRVEAHSKSQGH